MTYTPSKDMVADLLTKPLPEPLYRLLRTRTGILLPPPSAIASSAGEEETHCSALQLSEKLGMRGSVESSVQSFIQL